MIQDHAENKVLNGCLPAISKAIHMIYTHKTKTKTNKKQQQQQKPTAIIKYLYFGLMN